MTSSPHAGRKHSIFPPSGADRWTECSGSVSLGANLPDKENKYSIYGTQAHEALETVMREMIEGKRRLSSGPGEIWGEAAKAAHFITGVWQKIPGSEILVESRVYLPFIHHRMFGSFDGAVIDHWGTLHVFDYKFGKFPVSPKENLQEIIYALGLAYKYDWNFKNVRLWIIQPRTDHYEGPIFWECSLDHVRSFIPKLRKAVKRAETHPNDYKEGSWCHFCKAKEICPLKREVKLAKTKNVFADYLTIKEN